MALSLADTVETKARPQAWRASQDRSARVAGRHEAAAGSLAGRQPFRLESEDAAARPEASAKPAEKPAEKPQADASRTPERQTQRATADRPGSTTAKPSSADKPQPRAGGDRTGAARVETDGAPAQAAGQLSTEASEAYGEAGEAAATTAAEQPAETLPGVQAPTPLAPFTPTPSAPTLTGQIRLPTGTSQCETVEGDAVALPGIAAQAGGGTVATGPRKAEAGFEAALAAVATESTAGETPVAASAPPPPGISQSATPTAETKAAPSTQPPVPSPAPVPLGAVPMTIGLRALGAASRFEIRLDPVELGRIDVALDIDRDSGTVGARLVVDRPETLALLQRDASSLQQALAQTGLDASAGIALSLRDGGGERRREGGADTGGQPRAAGGDDASQTQNTISPIGLDAAPLRALRGYGGLDIRI